MSDVFDLERFVVAQDPVYEEVLTELRSGAKSGHWMWFIFPQIAGLGSSWMAQKYAISSLAEAAAYLQHPILGARLIDCTQLVLSIGGRSIREIFGPIDGLKFRSSMTLFAEVAGAPAIFREALQQHFHGRPDPLTRERI